MVLISLIQKLKVIKNNLLHLSIRFKEFYGFPIYQYSIVIYVTTTFYTMDHYDV
jgi:hypothetical protein